MGVRNTHHPFMTTFNMRQDNQDSVSKLMSEAERRNAIRQNIERYRILGSLLAGKETDITGDPAIFAQLNRERLSLDEFMSFYPEDCARAEQEASQERELNPDGWNPKSKARWALLGIPPMCVADLFDRVYEGDERKRALKRFFKQYPRFAVAQSKHFHNVGAVDA